MVDFAAGERSWWRRSRWWRVPVALVVTIILSICGILWLAGLDRPRSEQGAGLSLARPLSQQAPCAGQSFSPDTLVLLANGTKRPIAELKAGERVWSFDPETGHTSGQLVQAVLVNHDTELIDLTITSPADVTSVIHTTANHPFYSTDRAQASSSEVVDWPPPLAQPSGRAPNGSMRKTCTPAIGWPPPSGTALHTSQAARRYSARPTCGI